jgi:hypothetical protein
MSGNDKKTDAPPSDNDKRTDPSPRPAKGERSHRRAASEVTSDSLQASRASTYQQRGIIQKFKKSQGKGWDYFSHSDAEKILSPDPKTNLRKTSLLTKDGEHLRSPSIGPKIPRPFSAPPGQDSDVVPALDTQYVGGDLPSRPQVTILGLSPIHVVYSRAPLLSQDFGSLSPASLGAPSQHSLPSTIASSRELPHVLPKGISAYEYALGPFFENLEDHFDKHQFCLPPLTKHEDESQAAVSLQDDEELFGVDVQIRTEPPEYGIPADILEYVPNAKLRSMQIRVSLMRCAVLQTTIRELQRKPWATRKTRTPRWYYEQMRKLSYEAYALAESLKSKDLKARCAYWFGRACGGTRDYGAAEDYFWEALLGDVENGVYRSGRVKLRGLRPTEKADVKFLLQSCTKRNADYVERERPKREWAEIQSEATGIPIEVLIEDTMPQSPPWVPDRDRVMLIAQGAFDPEARRYKDVQGVFGPLSNERAKVLVDMLGEELESGLQSQWKSEEKHVRDIYRRTLSDDEWKYIRHGDYKTTHAIARQHSPDGSANNAPPVRRLTPKTLADHLKSLSTRSNSMESISEDAARERGWIFPNKKSVPSGLSFEQSSPRIGQDMSRPATAERISPTTLSQSDAEPPGPQSLQQRRDHITIPADQIEISQTQPRLEQDTQASSPASNADGQ